MGTDIHFYVERYENGKWVHVVDSGIPCERSNCQDADPDEDDGFRCYRCKDTGFERFYRQRNYWLFGVLAGVRGMHPPIKLPKGLPSDLSDEVTVEWRRGESDWHTPTYLTLAELNTFNWLGTYEARMFASPVEFLAHRATGSPIEVGHTRSTQVSEGLMHQFLHGLWEHDAGRTPITEVQWADPIVNVARKFVEETLPALDRVAIIAGGNHNVRCIYWFDN